MCVNPTDFTVTFSNPDICTCNIHIGDLSSNYFNLSPKQMDESVVTVTVGSKTFVFNYHVTFTIQVSVSEAIEKVNELEKGEMTEYLYSVAGYIKEFLTYFDFILRDLNSSEVTMYVFNSDAYRFSEGAQVKVSGRLGWYEYNGVDYPTFINPQITSF